MGSACSLNWRGKAEGTEAVNGAWIHSGGATHLGPHASSLCRRGLLGVLWEAKGAAQRGVRFGADGGGLRARSR
jgi:hypothetical protein